MTNRAEKTGQLMERLHAFRRLMAPEAQTEIGAECLSHSQWLVLHLVGRQEGIGIKELAAQLGISPSATTQLVDCLVNKGFLNRASSPEDRRALCLTLPEKSREQIGKLREQKMKHLCKIFSPLNDYEFDTLLELLDKVINNTPSEKR